ncbi:MAG: hypothetical protein II114_00010 [Treponema sp.]|nr:hypothetical protein [Treponema sp.]
MDSAFCFHFPLRDSCGVRWSCRFFLAFSVGASSVLCRLCNSVHDCELEKICVVPELFNEPSEKGRVHSI